MNKILLLITIVIGVWRLFIDSRLNLPTSTGFHEAIAHIWVGFLIGLWISKREDKTPLWLLMGITILEISVFIAALFFNEMFQMLSGNK